MPIYEFFCDDCNTIFSFLSRRINTTASPDCPRCARKNLRRRVSSFAVTGRAKENSAGDDPPFDERKMERAMESLAREAERIDENDPRQAALLMRRLTDMTGLELGDGMREALGRLERGEDPDAIEAELGSLMEGEDPFVLPEKNKAAAGGRQPFKDDTLYELAG